MLSKLGCEHRRDTGVKQVNMVVLRTRNKYFNEKSLYIQCHYIGGYEYADGKFLLLSLFLGSKNAVYESKYS